MNRRSITAALAAGVLAAGTVIAAGQPANAAAPTISASVSRAGVFALPTISGQVNGKCDKDISVTVVDRDTKIIQGSTTVSTKGGAYKIAQLKQSGGDFEVIANCASYGSPSTSGRQDGSWTVTQQVSAYSLINISPESFQQGQKVTLSSDGFAPGEKVVLTMRFHAHKKAVSDFAPTAVADGQGNVSFQLALPYKNLPLGTYGLVMTGSSSRHVANGAMYWGSPSHDKKPGKKPGKVRPVKGLPSTGV